MTFSPRMTISPVRPGGSACPASSQMRSSIAGAIRPEEPSLWALRLLAEMTGEASVSP